MGITTLLRYLTGSREAIRAIAGNRHALWVGFLFVLSAGFAREYDGEDLLHEPWYVVIPVAASLGTSFLLFLVAYGIVNVKVWETLPSFGSTYLSFLGLFWMTAPLAWLYAVPYEQFLSPADAMRANLWTLAVVSAWRVALMVRVLPILLPYSHLQAFFLVLTFGTVVALSLILFLPVPLIDVMGGIRLSERDQVMRGVALAVGQLGCYSLFVWVIGLLFVIGARVPFWQPPTSAGGRPGSLPWLAVAALAVWPFVLPHAQPPQQRRREVEKLHAQGEFAAAVAAMSRHARSDYPPGWVPPPRRFSLVVGGEKTLALLEELTKEETAPWVRDCYLDRVTEALGHLEYFQDEDLQRLGKVLARIPGGSQAIERGLGRWEKRYSAQGAEEMRRLLRGEPREQKGSGPR